jgi:DNA-binding NarL/FixJ family response regulator
MAAVTNIVLIENTFLIRSGLEVLVQEIPGMLITDVFNGNEKNLIDKINHKKPEIVMINPDALGEDFITVVTKLQADADLKMVGLIKEDSPENIVSRFKHHLSINENKHTLLTQLRKVCGNTGKCQDNRQGPLSKREIIILIEVVKGLTNQEIADKLFLSIHTVMTHRKNITKKLGIKTVSGLMVYSLMNNIVDMREVERSI